MTWSKILIILCLSNFTLMAYSEEPQPEDATLDKKAEKKQAVKPGQPVPAAKNAKVKTADTFVPSEDISEDLSVSYPTDI